MNCSDTPSGRLGACVPVSTVSAGTYVGIAIDAEERRRAGGAADRKTRALVAKKRLQSNGGNGSGGGIVRGARKGSLYLGFDDTLTHTADTSV